MGELNPDVKLMFDAITRKRAVYDTLEAYYEGRQPIVYLTERLRDVFASVDARFTQNWCAVVIDACKERINLRGFSTGKDELDVRLAELFHSNDGALESDDVHLYSLIFGEAFVLVERDEEGVNWYYNDPRLVHVEYDSERPRTKRVAGKLWVTTDGTYRLTLYYEDHFEYYLTNKKAKEVSAASSFTPDPTYVNWPKNDYPDIPVFHFRIARKPISDLVNVIEPQNGINKLLADMMVAAEYGAFRQRYIISSTDTTNTRLASEPGGLWSLPAAAEGEQATAVGEFSATDLANYLSAIDKLAASIAIISRTPKHYLFSESGTPSGEALIAMEAPLNKKAQDRIERFVPEWRRLARFLMQLVGVELMLTDITPDFDTPETVQPEMEANITKTRVEAGVPLTVALEWEGRTAEDIAAVEKAQAEAEKKAAAARQADLAKAALAFNRGVVSESTPDAQGVSNPSDLNE